MNLYAPDYGDLTLGSAEHEEIRSLRILEVIFGSNGTFVTHIREVVSNTARSFGVVRRAGKLFDYPRVLKSCFNAYVLSNYSIVIPCKCRLRSLICICWIEWFAMGRGCVRGNLLFGTQKEGQCLVIAL